MSAVSKALKELAKRQAAGSLDANEAARLEGAGRRVIDLMQPIGASRMVGKEKMILDTPDPRSHAVLKTVHLVMRIVARRLQ